MNTNTCIIFAITHSTFSGSFTIYFIYHSQSAHVESQSYRINTHLSFTFYTFLFASLLRFVIYTVILFDSLFCLPNFRFHFNNGIDSTQSEARARNARISHWPHWKRFLFFLFYFPTFIGSGFGYSMQQWNDDDDDGLSWSRVGRHRIWWDLEPDDSFLLSVHYSTSISQLCVCVCFGLKKKSEIIPIIVST